jgi:hypothetical protein
MTIKTPIRCLMLLAAAFAISETALAQRVVDNNTTTAELAMTATAQTVLNLDISTNGGATVAGDPNSGLFTISLGNVNGLGIGTPGAGVTPDVQALGTLYTTPITLTPTFSGFTTEAANLTVKYDGAAGNALGNAAVREGAAAASVAALTTTAAEAINGVVTGTDYDRYIGFFVSNVNGASAVEGVLETTIVYTITAAP